MATSHTVSKGKPTNEPSNQPTRIRSRDRIIAVGITTAMLSRAVGLAAPLVITPVCFRYLGDERYGLWMTITALTGMAWLADLGLGNGLLTRLSHLSGDAPRQRREISTAYAALGAVAGSLLLGLIVASPIISWDKVFAVADPQVASEASVIVIVCFISFLINMPLSLIQRIQYANGQVMQSNLWQSGGALLSVTGVLAAIKVGWQPVLVISCAVFAIPLGNLVNSVAYFRRQGRAVRPGLGQVDRETAASLLRLGLQFFALTAMSSIALNLDSPLVAHSLGLTAAAHYAVAGKAFGVLSLFVGIIGMTVWAANGSALSRGDVHWVRRSTRRMVALCALLVGAAGLLLVVYGHQLMRLWVGTVDTSVVSLQVLCGLACWSFLIAVTTPLIMVQNSVGVLRPQFYGWAAFLFVATILKLWAIQVFGLYGLPIAACVSYVLTVWPAVCIGYRKALWNAANAIHVLPGEAAGRSRQHVGGDANSNA